MPSKLTMQELVRVLVARTSRVDHPAVVVRNEGRVVDEAHLTRWIVASAMDAGIDVRSIDVSHGSPTAEDLDGSPNDLLIVHELGCAGPAELRSIERIVVDAVEREDARRVLVVQSTTWLSQVAMSRAFLCVLAMERRLTAPLVHLMREASGLGMMDCKAAAELAIAEYDADFVLALGIRNAASYAVRIGSRDPRISAQEARRRWNVAHALDARDSMAARSDAWRRLDELSGRHRP